MTHHCHALGCTAATPRRLLMCAHHWSLVPSALQRAVLAHFDPRQCWVGLGRVPPSPAWVAAAARAKAHVARVEDNERAAEWLEEIAAAAERRAAGAAS